jgi:hypothetical protein
VPDVHPDRELESRLLAAVKEPRLDSLAAVEACGADSMHAVDNGHALVVYENRR